MLYSILKIPAKLAFWIYCRNILINKPGLLQNRGPLLIACNHPNSFLDAIIIATLFKQPIYSLTRGDAFNKKGYRKILSLLKMLPVYRISEGTENLEHNYQTFKNCKEIFKQKGIVLIFSEGRCVNEWHLRSLKKGTARLAVSSWKDNIPLKILPAGINYSSFRLFGKNIQLNFGEIITAENIQFNDNDTEGKSINSFNQKLQNALQDLTIEINPTDKEVIIEKFAVKISLLKKIILFLPAIVGWLIHFPLYYPIKKISLWKAAQYDHFDSVTTGLLFILYPFYLLLISLLVYWLIGEWWWLLSFIIFPFCAWSYVQMKRQF